MAETKRVVTTVQRITSLKGFVMDHKSKSGVRKSKKTPPKSFAELICKNRTSSISRTSLICFRAAPDRVKGWAARA